VAVEATAIPEIAGAAAWQVPPHSVREIAKAEPMAYNESLVCRKFILEGKARALRYPWNKTAQTFLRVFQNITGAKQVITS
jgi:hypothetical protein